MYRRPGAYPLDATFQEMRAGSDQWTAYLLNEYAADSLMERYEVVRRRLKDQARRGDQQAAKILTESMPTTRRILATYLDATFRAFPRPELDHLPSRSPYRDAYDRWHEFAARERYDVASLPPDKQARLADSLLDFRNAVCDMLMDRMRKEAEPRTNYDLNLADEETLYECAVAHDAFLNYADDTLAVFPPPRGRKKPIAYASESKSEWQRRHAERAERMRRQVDRFPTMREGEHIAPYPGARPYPPDGNRQVPPAYLYADRPAYKELAPLAAIRRQAQRARDAFAQMGFAVTPPPRKASTPSGADVWGNRHMTQLAGDRPDRQSDGYVRGYVRTVDGRQQRVSGYWRGQARRPR